VSLRTPTGEELTDAAIGTGPVDAVYKAINRVVNVPNELIEFSVQSVTKGIDAMGEVTIRLRHNERVYSGHAANTDIIVASAQAYVNALNRLYGSLQGDQTLKEKLSSRESPNLSFVEKRSEASPQADESGAAEEPTVVRVSKQ
jgi:2-isopropylmalate synthase